MPKKPPKTCRQPGCRELAVKGYYCPEHSGLVGGKKKDFRPSAYRRGYDKKWAKFSREFLRDNPLCEICGSPATVTDHRVPFEIMKKVYGGNTYRPEDYQALCTSCNTRKGRNEDKWMKEGFS